jgi:hypothetical protein
MLALILQNTPEANAVRMRLRVEIRKRVSRIGVLFDPKSDSVFLAINYVNGHTAVAETKRDGSSMEIAEYAVDREAKKSTLAKHTGWSFE